MNDPDPRYERKVLRDVVRQMRDAEETGRKQTQLRRIILGAGYAGLLAAFFFSLNDLVHPFTSAFLAAFAGCALGFAVFLQFAHKQWPVTRRHIDMESIRRRLDELESRGSTDR